MTLHLGRHGEAVELARASVALADGPAQITGLVTLAFELLEPLAEVQLEIDCLHTYAETCRAAGRCEEALALLDRTIKLARELGRPQDERRARSAREVVRAGR